VKHHDVLYSVVENRCVMAAGHRYSEILIIYSYSFRFSYCSMIISRTLSSPVASPGKCVMISMVVEGHHHTLAR